MEKCLILFSGGLDSRLVLKIMQKLKFKIFTVFFKLPFCKDNEKEIKAFVKKNNSNLKIFNCTKGKLLEEYLEIIKNPEYKRGAGINPCIDCKIFMFKKAKKFADSKNINLIVSGEILNERPLSQTKKAMQIIDKNSNIEDRILRPLTELYNIQGRQRKKQINLARKFSISYPSPGGGCLLCEKELRKRFETIINKNLVNEKTLSIIKIGRHFLIEDCWLVVGRNKEENLIIEKNENSIFSKKGNPAVYYSSKKKKCRELAEKLQKDYKKGGKKIYSKFKL
jgi:tRNA-uridine 2-sulfurtransferase